MRLASHVTTVATTTLVAVVSVGGRRSLSSSRKVRRTGGVPYERFKSYMLSHINSAFDPARERTVCDDMTRPLARSGGRARAAARPRWGGTPESLSRALFSLVARPDLSLSRSLSLSLLVACGEKR